jgi:hypothetical protein
MSEPEVVDRLERMAARLLTQRAYLDAAAGLVEGMRGPILEIGLGKGRTYSHMQRLFPGRAIVAFDRDLHAPKAAQPPPGRLILGDFRETLPAARARIGGPAILAHADIGTEDLGRDAALARFIGPQLTGLMAAGGIIVTDRALSAPGVDPLPGPPIDMPPGLSAWSYFMYRVQ